MFWVVKLEEKFFKYLCIRIDFRLYELKIIDGNFVDISWDKKLKVWCYGSILLKLFIIMILIWRKEYFCVIIFFFWLGLINYVILFEFKLVW